MTSDPNILINPMVRWAIHPGHEGTIEYVAGIGGPQTLPNENEVITRPFLVDPHSRLPIPVRVSQVLKMWDSGSRQHILAVVVAREQ